MFVAGECTCMCSEHKFTLALEVGIVSFSLFTEHKDECPWHSDEVNKFKQCWIHVCVRVCKVRTSRRWVMGNRLASFKIMHFVSFFYQCMTIAWDSYVVCICEHCQLHKPLWLFDHQAKLLNVVIVNEEECWEDLCDRTSFVLGISSQSVCFVIYEFIPYCEVHMCLEWLLKVPIGSLFECHMMFKETSTTSKQVVLCLKLCLWETGDTCMWMWTQLGYTTKTL